MHARILGTLGISFALACPATAQTFVLNTADIPNGSPGNNSVSENVDFADVDLDGDWDAAFADGGDLGNDQNRIWVNQGPGNLGVFVDETAARFPAVADDSRDVEFVDFDSDGDPDLYVSNTAQIVNQSSRWWQNQGVGDGVYRDETNTRWLNLGLNDGTSTFSSISPAAVLPQGGFIDWSCDCDFADLDNDGDMDLVHSSYGGAFGGGVPTRIFLNDGLGFFEEFNPSGHQLGGTQINNGDPAIWASGQHQHFATDSTGLFADIANDPLDIDLGDLDGDLDIDILHGARDALPRVFINQLEQNGGILAPFRDETTARLFQNATGGGNYEQELGDIDNDGDLDIYGLNWQGFTDIISRNDGNANFGPFVTLDGSGSDDNEGDFIDFDNDGDNDLFVANFSGQDRLYENDGAGNYTNVTSAELPSNIRTTTDADAADVDNDGDYDLFASNDSGQANTYYENVSQIADTHAPLLPTLEQAPDRTAGPLPTVVRVQVYDNAPYYTTWYNTTVLDVTVDGGPVTTYPMVSSGGQIFRGEISGSLTGTVCYTARSSDQYGNMGTSATRCYDAGGSLPLVYCTAKTSSAGCVASISTTAAFSQPTSGANDYAVNAMGVQELKNGLMFASISGAAAIPFNGGTLCMNPPTKRGPVMGSGGDNPFQCDGTYSTTVNDGMVIPAGLDAGPGNSAWYQYWYRDPMNGAGNLGTALSNAVQLTFQ